MKVHIINGIYKIENKANGKVYIGSSTNFLKRWNRHRRELNKNSHVNNHLQLSWNKYGEEVFAFEVVENILDNKSRKYIFEREQYWMNYYQSYERDKGYNISLRADCPPAAVNKTSFKKGTAPWNKGKTNVYSSETLELMRNKVVSDETREKMSESAKNKPKVSLETRKKMSESRRGEKNGGSKLTLEQVMEIRKKYIPFEYSIPKLAEEYSVSWTAIFSIIKNKTWKEEGDLIVE